MKKLFGLVLLTILLLPATAQQLYKTSFAPAGGSGSDGTQKIIYTTGEIFVKENTVGNTHLSEGFIGPDLAHQMGIEHYGLLKGVVLYPNPVSDRLHIRLPENKSYEIYLYDITGKELIHKKIQGKKTVLDLHDYLPGNYLLVVIDRDSGNYVSLKVKKI